MAEQKPNIGFTEQEIEDEGGTPDASLMTEGVGGVPDVADEERATVSDVDGDNVEPDVDRNPTP